MNSKDHFNHLAGNYEYWKNKNWYYYNNLKKLFRSFIPKGSTVWEIGCGTGDVLVSLEPSFGYGTDISDKMIEIAKQKYKNKTNIIFESKDINEISLDKNYNFIIIADVLEHLEDTEDFFIKLRKIVEPNVEIIISIANPFWEPLLILAEKLKMKMPEGPHHRNSIKKTEGFFVKNGFSIKETGYRLLIPKKIPFSDWINKNFYDIPFLKKLGFVIYWVITR